jgi:hypothetical protein
MISDGFLSFEGFGVSVWAPFFFFLPFFCASAGRAVKRHNTMSRMLERVKIGFIGFGL